MERIRMRRQTIIRTGLCLAAGLCAVLAATGIAAGAPSKPAATPTKDVVGKGLINCAVATGEVGYSPATIAGGTKKERISIWFQAQKCQGSSTTGVVGPVPATVTGSISFISDRKNACPQLGLLGKGVLNLSYNQPPVPVLMIDPSVAPNVTVTQSGPYWILKGRVTWGSFPDPVTKTFVAELKPDVIGTQNCKTGITSEYIIRAQSPFLINI
jgi:hypothetical protein